MMSRGRPSGGDALLAVVFHGHPLHFVWRLVNGVCESALPPCLRGSPPDDSAHVHYFMARSACSSDYRPHRHPACLLADSATDKETS